MWPKNGQSSRLSALEMPSVPWRVWRTVRTRETDDVVHAVWASKIATRLGRTDAAVANHLRAADMSECEGFKAHHLSLAVGLMAIDDPQLRVTTQTLMSPTAWRRDCLLCRASDAVFQRC